MEAMIWSLRTSPQQSLHAIVWLNKAHYHISSRFFSNSEASASELLENRDEIVQEGIIAFNSIFLYICEKSLIICKS